MNSKIIFLTATLLISTLPSAFSQIVTENVLFDNYISSTNNDFTNHFTGGLGLTQITTNGITGGCLTTPNTENMNWGNDNAIYCSKYIGANTYYAKTSVCFKYDSTQINSVNFDRAVSIWLNPSADFNHYIIASVTYNKKLQIVTYSWANNLPSLNLLNAHWYQLLLQANFVTASPDYQINITASVNDLGLTGLTPPVPVGSSSGMINDSILFGDSAVQVSIAGTLWGGAKYLDNFHFEGIKSADSCLTIPTGVAVNETDDDVILFPNPARNKLAIGNRQYANESIEIYDILGEKRLTLTLFPDNNRDRRGEGTASIDVSKLAPGIYFLRIVSDEKFVTKKFVVSD